ncbi:MAG: deoxyribose-phosphate aldolase [bacterium]|nr:deoxyribose-phosphate aldolase [bacterium]
MTEQQSVGIASAIDHTELRPDAIRDQIVVLCREAAQFSFAAVCVNPVWVAEASRLLKDHDVAVATVCSFPLGACVPHVKAVEAKRSIEDGASEIDMVLNIGATKAGEWSRVEEDIAAVVEVVNPTSGFVKVILECGLLSDEEKALAAQCAVRAGALYVKTSTGMLGSGATTHDVALLRRAVGSRAKVKAAGGIRTLAQAQEMLTAGADRLGTSSGVAIFEEAHQTVKREAQD